MEAAAIARWAYERTGCDEARPPGPGTILHGLVGANRVRFAHAKLSVSRYPILGIVVTIPTDLTDEFLCMALAMGAARAAILLRGGRTNYDRRCVSLAAADIVMPRLAVQATVAAIGPSAADVARAFVVPTIVAEGQLRRFGIRLASGTHSSAKWRAAKSVG